MKKEFPAKVGLVKYDCGHIKENGEHYESKSTKKIFCSRQCAVNDFNSEKLTNFFNSPKVVKAINEVLKNA